MRERRKENERGGERKNDMLRALFDEDGNGGGFSDEEIVDFLLSLLVAGYDTTSTIMTLAVKFLTETPQALAQLKVIIFPSPHPFLFSSLFLFFFGSILIDSCLWAIIRIPPSTMFVPSSVRG